MKNQIKKKKQPADIIFPDGFLWGAATSAHQVEGDNHNNWAVWEKSSDRLRQLTESGLIKKYGKQNFISGLASDHYRKYKEDFALAKKLGHNATRFSLEWSRIEPKPGEFDESALEHYRKVLITLRGLGIEPMVTLWHWTLPVWLARKGGFEKESVVKYFERYVKKIIDTLGPQIRYWLTINEPKVYANHSYIAGKWPPQKKNFIAYSQVLRHLVKSHKRAYTIIKQADPSAQVGLAKNVVYFEAQGKSLINRFLKKLGDTQFNFDFLKRIGDYQDFIGLNYYFHNLVDHGFGKNKNRRVSDIGWELYPPGIYHVLKSLQRFEKPIYITENGLADKRDKNRTWFIKQTLKHVDSAIKDGVDVRGYFHWSLIDNFEWARGFVPRFGLIEVDYKTQKRTARPSALIYAQICRDNGWADDDS